MSGEEISKTFDKDGPCLPKEAVKFIKQAVVHAADVRRANRLQVYIDYTDTRVGVSVVITSTLEVSS